MAEALGHDLQRHGLAGTGRTRDESVAIRLLKQQVDVLGISSGSDTHPDSIVLQHSVSLSCGSRAVR